MICDPEAHFFQVRLFLKGTNHFVTPLVENDPDERVHNLFVDLRDNHLIFFELGGADGRLYVIRDPESQVAPFVLSGEVPGQYTHYEAAGGIDEEGLSHPGLCGGREGELMTKAQAKALGRALRAVPGGLNHAIAGLVDTEVWLLPVHPDDSTYGFFFDASAGSVEEDYRISWGSVRCVRAI